MSWWEIGEFIGHGTPSLPVSLYNAYYSKNFYLALRSEADVASYGKSRLYLTVYCAEATCEPPVLLLSSTL